MSFEVKIIADSRHYACNSRLTTFQLRYPRFIHAEVMTHRMFSRNASSSRAIPVEKMIQSVIDDPAMPVFWGSNKPGMQAGDEVEDVRLAKALWRTARHAAVDMAQRLHREGLHKQIVNRVLEPFGHISVVLTATDFANFFALRDHSDAQPEIRHLAKLMREAYDASTPTMLEHGQWHLPYVDAHIEDDGEQSYRHHLTDLGDSVQGIQFIELDQAIKCSVARCARVSYLTHEGKTPSIEADLALYDRLMGSTPLHASPAEHQASPYSQEVFGANQYGVEHTKQALCGNFASGWVQFRKTLPNEYVPG